ncbi:hypothetical protein CASFOL_031050 [Castilleja foliolosa]|uniref:Protein TILLER ANGLE CONTROL 1 n=1 Tax=Castilleja foliolosa TaxID=1961234 RepID=A0ABD3C4C1_9LAMI
MRKVRDRFWAASKQPQRAAIAIRVSKRACPFCRPIFCRTRGHPFLILLFGLVMISKLISSNQNSNFPRIMKIFNWVQRKFSNNKENAENNKNTISVIGDHDHHLWSGGILSIGTFGYDPLTDNNNIREQTNDHFLDHEEIVVYDQTNDDNSDEDQEDEDQNNEKEEEEETFVFEANYEQESEFDYVMMEKKERITLADLFSADHVHDDYNEKHKNKPINNINNNNNNNVSMKKSGKMGKEKAIFKHGFGSYTKARPIHKLNQIVRRMMRRKIHPDQLSSYKIPVKKCENASLLQIQDVITL